MPDHYSLCIRYSAVKVRFKFSVERSLIGRLVLGRPYPEDLEGKGQKALDDDITAYREPAPIQEHG